MSGAHPLDGVQHGDRADAAVAADHVRAPAFNPRRKGLRSRAVEAVSVFVDGDVRHHRDLGIHVPRRQNRLVKFFHVAEGFQHQQIDAAFDQGCDLLAEGGAGFLEGGLAQRFNADSQRANRAGNPDVEALGRFARQTNPGQVDLADLVFQAVACQAKGIAPKSIGFNDLRTRLQILMVKLRGSGRAARDSVRHSSD